MYSFDTQKRQPRPRTGLRYVRYLRSSIQLTPLAHPKFASLPNLHVIFLKRLADAEKSQLNAHEFELLTKSSRLLDNRTHLHALFIHHP